MRNYMLVKGGKPGGELIAVLEFLPAADLVVTAIKGKDLRNPNWMGTADPYIYLESESMVATAGDWNVRSKVINKGGKTPDWGGEVLDAVKIVDHDKVMITVYDSDIGKDDKIGFIELGMVDILGRGSKERWLKLKTKKGKPAGDILVQIKCVLPMGTTEAAMKRLAWPHCRPSSKPVVVGLLKGGGEAAGEGDEGEVVKKEEKELSANEIWEEAWDEEGNVYYFNTQTEEMSWDMPEGFVDLDTGEAIDVLGGLPVVGAAEELTGYDRVLAAPSRGRLDVKIVECEGVEGKDSSLQCYAIVKLGAAKKKGDFWKKTKTTKKVEEGKPEFGKGVMSLNFRDMDKAKKVLGVEKGKEWWEVENVRLRVEVWEDNYMKDVKLGTAVIDVLELMCRPATPWEQWFDLEDGEGAGAGRIKLHLQFLAVYEGMLRMKLLEGVGLKNPDMVGAPDP
jgi:hypothetical protein